MIDSLHGIEWNTKICPIMVWDIIQHSHWCTAPKSLSSARAVSKESTQQPPRINICCCVGIIGIARSALKLQFKYERTQPLQMVFNWKSCTQEKKWFVLDVTHRHHDSHRSHQPSRQYTRNWTGMFWSNFTVAAFSIEKNELFVSVYFFFLFHFHCSDSVHNNCWFH